MDPVSQAVLGAAAPLSVSRSRRAKSENRGAKLVNIAGTAPVAWVALFAALAGMAPDLDVLIRSDTDPLLFLEYHRQFTHSLIFIPVGAGLCAVAFWPLAKRHFSLLQLWWVCLLGYGTHALLDACTTYGTQLFWPFSDQRVAWNNVSVIDPLFTLPLLMGVAATARTGRLGFVRLGLLWGIAYLLLGVWQNHRAEEAGWALAQMRGHEPVRLEAKPGFANLLLWKVVYEAEGRFWVDAVRTGWETHVFTGESIAKLDPPTHLPWLAEHSQQAIDLARFRWFSNDYLAIDPDNQQRIVDMRYSVLPNDINALWGIELDPEAGPDEHVEYRVQRDTSAEQLERWWQMLSH